MRIVTNFINILKTRLRRDVTLEYGVKINSKTILEGSNKIFKRANIANSNIGYGSYIGVESFLPRTLVGRYSAIGPRVRLVRGAHPSKNFVSIHPAFYSTRKQAGFTYVTENKFNELDNEKKYSVEIGNDVWIGSDVIILDGVKVGDGAIIGSGAIISKDIDAYTINVGNPIKMIGKRFDDNKVESLLSIQWWNRDTSWVIENSDYFEDIDKFLKNL